MSRANDTSRAILAGYDRVADRDFIRANEALAPEVIYGSVIDLFPGQATDATARVLDLGSGSGRDAGWFAGLGHEVVAVEPVARLRDAARRLHPAPTIVHFDATLPDIGGVRSLGPFDFVLLSGVWQHLDDGEREASMEALGGMMAEGGRVAMSLRHGPAAPHRPVHAVDVATTLRLASRFGFRLLRRTSVASIQPGNIARGVTWTWLVMEWKSPDASR